MHSRFELANALRALSMDAVQKANSGHPGMPMGMADIAEVLWNDFLNHNPNNPQWFNRDRFVLSNGHGSMLQYALLHLSGYPLTVEDIKSFRQLHSNTPGHPEFGITVGVETTTGPLGQGLGNAVGFALAETLLAAHFNRPSYPIVDHFTYCFVGDGCLMEGISHEVASLAGTLGLGKLIVFWDDNGISIDGKVEGWFTEDTALRFEAYGWQVIRQVNGHDPDQIKNALLKARGETTKPSFICCKTTIGFGAPTLAGTAKTHGAPLGEHEIARAREYLQWNYKAFEIPEAIYAAWDARGTGQSRQAKWDALFHQYSLAYPELSTELMRRMQQQLPDAFEENIQAFIRNTDTQQENIATRKASEQVLEMLVPRLPELIGGSADLSESNLTFTKNSIAIRSQHFNGNYIYYGVREFGMSAIMNGLALHGGFIPYGGTFLTFLDYARNAVRLSAFMKQRVIYIYTHDSVGLGEDGPTHQPIEHLAMLRATPNMSLWRPCDAVETAVAWHMALQRKEGPTSLALTRQSVKHQTRTNEQMANIAKGAYILRESLHLLQCIIIATGSEVSIAMEATLALAAEGLGVRLVSMPSMDVFLKQEAQYRETVLPSHLKARVAVEAASPIDWYRWVGFEGEIVGIDRFGESAPGAQVLAYLGMTPENIIAAVKRVVGVENASRKMIG